MNEQQLARMISGSDEELTPQNYREYPCLSQTLLKRFDTHPSKALEEFDLSGPSINKGSVVDIMLLDGPETFEDGYYIEEDVRPNSDSIAAIAEGVFQRILEAEENGNDLFYNGKVEAEVIAEEAKQVGYGQSWKDSTVLRKFGEDNGWEYVASLYKNRGKIGITQGQYDECVAAKQTLLTHPFTKHYFINPDPNIEIHNQLPLKGALAVDSESEDSTVTKHGLVHIKGLLDIVITDHNNKTVTPVDLKTTSSFLNGWVNYSFEKYGYDIQAAYYSMLMSQNMDSFAKDYRLMPFEFVVYSFASETPFVVPLTYKRISQDMTRVYNLVNDFKWHIDKDLWEYPREVYENNGRITIGVEDE
jgi:hypothetical protein